MKKGSTLWVWAPFLGGPCGARASEVCTSRSCGLKCTVSAKLHLAAS